MCNSLCFHSGPSVSERAEWLRGTPHEFTVLHLRSYAMNCYGTGQVEALRPQQVDIGAKKKSSEHQETKSGQLKAGWSKAERERGTSRAEGLTLTGEWGQVGTVRARGRETWRHETLPQEGRQRGNRQAQPVLLRLHTQCSGVVYSLFSLEPHSPLGSSARVCGIQPLRCPAVSVIHKILNHIISKISLWTYAWNKCSECEWWRQKQCQSPDSSGNHPEVSGVPAAIMSEKLGPVHIALNRTCKSWWLTQCV